MSTNGPCRDLVPSEGLPSFAIAYQPIVNVPSRQVVAYEALTRGGNGASFLQLVAAMDPETARRFHRRAAEESIRGAVALGLSQRNAALTLNLQPDLHPDALNAEFLHRAAIHHGLSPSRIVVELTEDHHLTLSQLRELLSRNKAAGFLSAMDDFGAGYSGLTYLAECRPEILKLDRALICDIDRSEAKQEIVGAFARVCKALHMLFMAEGVETLEECRMLRRLGVTIMQGYLFSRPVVGALPRFEDCMRSRSVKDLGRRSNLADSGLHVYKWDGIAWITPQARTV